MGSSFLVGDSFLSGEGTPLGCIWFYGRMGEGGWQKSHGAGGTPIIPLPNSTNPGLCCNRIKKMQELQYALENLQEKGLNFARKGTSSQIDF